MGRFHIGLVGTMLSLFSGLLGCKTIDLSGPDFEDPILKVAQVEPSLQLSYEVPGNMSKLMNFAERYKSESPRTYKIGLDNNVDFKTEQWRLSHKIDGAMWEYHGPKDKGIDGALGELNFRISLDKSDKNKNLSEFIIDSIDHYLNGPDGFNTEVRESEIGEGKTDEELGSWIIKTPTSLEPLTQSDRKFLSFSIVWREGEYYKYFVLPVNDERFLTLTFRYTVSANSGEEHSENEKIILQDIEKMVANIAIQ